MPGFQLCEQAARCRGVQPQAEEIQGLAGGLARDELVQVLAVGVLITAGRAGHQRRWRVLGMQGAAGQFIAELLRQGFEVFQRLWAGKAQGHLPALVKARVERPQCQLKRLMLDRQAVAIARMKATQRMVSR